MGFFSLGPRRKKTVGVPEKKATEVFFSPSSAKSGVLGTAIISPKRNLYFSLGVRTECVWILPVVQMARSVELSLSVSLSLSRSPYVLYGADCVSLFLVARAPVSRLVQFS